MDGLNFVHRVVISLSGCRDGSLQCECMVLPVSLIQIDTKSCKEDSRDTEGNRVGNQHFGCYKENHGMELIIPRFVLFRSLFSSQFLQS